MAYPYGYTGYTPQYQQQYPQQPMQTPMQQQVQSPQHIVRPVASVEERVRYRRLFRCAYYHAGHGTRRDLHQTA